MDEQCAMTLFAGSNFTALTSPHGRAACRESYTTHLYTYFV